ncbi:MAG: hypothetical protein EOP88_11215 [Verrucomicrobiaceae bacterium]|nr:MAG: hypothetical protein EOP88_11215 [Verrucomicrobiaceae bacterium]
MEIKKPLTNEAWAPVHGKALEIADADSREDEMMAGVYVEQMMEVLDGLEDEYGRHATLVSTRADFLRDEEERRALYEVALILAKEQGDHEEVAQILGTLRQMDE